MKSPLFGKMATHRTEIKSSDYPSPKVLGKIVESGKNRTQTMPNDDQKKIKLPRTAKGKKPQYFEDPTVDKLLSMVLTLMGELSVTRDRLDTVERLIEKNGLFKVDSIETYDIPEEVNQVRMERRSAYIARVLKCVQDELEALQSKDDSQSTEPPEE